MNPLITSLTLAASSANNICLSQTPGGAGNLTLNGSTVTSGVATLDVARRVLFTFAGDEHTKTVVLFGTDRFGNAQSETIVPSTGAGTTASAYDYLTVTKITVSAAFAGAVTVGTNTVGSSQWFSVSREMTPVNVSFALTLPSGGGTNASVEYTYDDPNAIQGRPSVEPNSNIPPIAWTQTALASKTASADAMFNFPFFAYRLTVNSGTGTATLQSIQAGVAGN